MAASPPRVVLASASPRRLDLLTGLGLDPVPHPSGLEELVREGESPHDMVRRLAFEKTQAVVSALNRPGSVVIGADTAVVCDDRILGKPATEDQARAQLEQLSGRTHEVLTGICMQGSDGGRIATAVGRSLVRFRSLDDATIAWYVGSGEPMDKAGGYGIQGLGVLLIESIQGSWTNIVGLPLEKLPRLFEELGLDLLAVMAGSRSVSD